MTADDRAAIERLFARLADVAERAPRRDPQAEAFIERCVARQPGALYHLAQTVIAQESALRRIEARLGEAAEPAAGPWGRPVGGGFLAGAAQTAIGVMGGVLMADALSGLFESDGVDDPLAAGDAAADDGFGADGFGDDFEV